MYRRVQNIHTDRRARRLLEMIPPPPLPFPPQNFGRYFRGWPLTVRKRTHACVCVCVRGLCCDARPPVRRRCISPMRDACHARRARFRHFVSAVAPLSLPATVIRCALAAETVRRVCARAHRSFLYWKNNECYCVPSLMMF